MKFFQLLALCGLTSGLVACAAQQPPAIPERTALRPPVAKKTVPRDGGAAAARLSPTTGTLTLEAAIETALLSNPSLRADFAAFEAAALEVPQASSLMDPRVTYTQFVDGVQTRVGEQQFVAGVSQMFPWFGKLRLQGDVARSDAMQALESYRARMLDVRAQVRRAWYRLAHEQAALALAEEDKRAIEQTLEAAAALYGAGQRGRGALLQSQTELARIENELTGYPARIAALRQELARLLFVEDLGGVPALDEAEAAVMAVAEAEVLIAEAVALRPEIERFRLAEEQAELRHELALKDDYPDFTVGLNYIGVGDRPDNPMGAMAPPDEGDDAWGVSLGLNIPIPNARRRAAKDQALRQREAAEWRRIAAESEIEEEVRTLLPRLETLARQRDVLRGSLLPLVQEAYATNEAAYTSGQATFLDLLNAQRTLIAVRRDLLRTRLDTLLTLADLERAVGGSLAKEELR
ncbi:MAG: TolC family protein [Sumerlaeia bacterium]